MNEIAVLKHHAIGSYGGSDLSLFTSLDPATPGNKELLYNAMRAPDMDVRDIIGVPFPARDVVVFDSVEVSDETGEEGVVRRVSFIAPDGQVVSSGSKVVAGQFIGKDGAGTSEIIRFWGAPPWEPPMWFVAIERRSKAKRSYHILKVVGKPK